MPRLLNSEDIKILSKLAPEFSGEACAESGVHYKSILPPVANHYATCAEDFKERIERLTGDELERLVQLMLSGEESLHCLTPVYYSILEAKILKELGVDTANKVTAVYAINCQE